MFSHETKLVFKQWNNFVVTWKLQNRYSRSLIYHDHRIQKYHKRLQLQRITKSEVAVIEDLLYWDLNSSWFLIGTISRLLLLVLICYARKMKKRNSAIRFLLGQIFLAIISVFKNFSYKPWDLSQNLLFSSSFF